MPPPPSKPLCVYSIKDRGEESYWTRIGAAFVNKDNSLSVVLDCLPVDGRLHIREATQKEEENKP